MAIARPFQAQLQASRQLFCGGKTNFVWGEDPATHVVKTAETLTNDEFDNFLLSTARPEIIRPVLQRTQLPTKYAAELKAVGDLFILLEDAEGDLFDEETVSEVKELPVRDEAEAIDRLPCEDGDHVEAVRNGMRRSVQYDKCSELVQKVGCGEWQVRTFCPQSCHCADAHTVMFSRYGCTSQCNLQYQKSLTQLQREAESTGECVDSPEDFELHIFFEEFQQHLLDNRDLDRVSGGFTQAFKASFQRRFSWISLENTSGVNITGWWQEWMSLSSPGVEGPFPRSSMWGATCMLARYLEILFDTNLCEADVADGFGTLAPFCKKTCGWCGTPKAEVRMSVMAMHLKLLHHDDVIVYRAIDLENQICTRAGGASSHTITGTMEGVPDVRPGHSLEQVFIFTEQVFTFTAQHTGQYTFKVTEVAGHYFYMSMWGSVRRLWHDAKAAPCFTVNISGGQEVTLVVGSMSNQEADAFSFNLTVECPWVSGPRQYCLGSEDFVGVELSRQEAACSSVGEHEVLDDLGRESWYVALFLPVAEIIHGAPYAPRGLSYDPVKQILYSRGTGFEGTQCGEKFQCLCTQRAPRFNSLATACDKGVEGACKACVEDVDTYCETNEWDPMCIDLCTGICEPVCKASGGAVSVTTTACWDNDVTCADRAKTTWLCDGYFLAWWFVGPQRCCHCRGG